MAKASKYAKVTQPTEVKAETPSTVDIVTAAANVAATQNDITARKGHVSALAFAKAGGVALSNVLAHYADAKEVETQGPIETFCFLELKVNDATRAVIPVVGSKQGETGNQPYDRYTSEVITKDGKKKVPGSWYTDVVRNTYDCEQLELRIRTIDGVVDSDTPADMLAEIARLGAGQKAQERKRLVQRKAYMRKALTIGAMLWHHVEDISKLNPARIEILMPFKTEDTDKGYRIFSNVIRLCDPSKELEDKTYTVSEFLALDPAKIPDGTVKDLASLELTKARKPRTAGAGKDTSVKLPVPKTVEQFLMFCNTGHTAIDMKTDDGKMMIAKLLAACVAPGQGGNDATETIGDFLTTLDNELWAPIVGKYTKIKADKAEQQGTKLKAAV